MRGFKSHTSKFDSTPINAVADAKHNTNVIIPRTKQAIGVKINMAENSNATQRNEINVPESAAGAGTNTSPEEGLNTLITNTVNSVFFWVAIVIVAALGVASLFITYTFPQDWEEVPQLANAFKVATSFFATLLVCAILFAAVLKFDFKNPNKVRLICTFVVLAISVIWCTIANYGAFSDTTYMLAGTNVIMGGVEEGSAVFHNVETYFGSYPYQIGYLAYYYIMALIFRIDNYFAYRLINIVMIVVIVNVLPKIALHFTHSKKIASLTCILATLFLPLSFFSSFMYGNIPSFALCLAACYQALQIDLTNKKKLALRTSALAVCLFFALWFKPNASIFFIALGVWFALRAIKHKHPAYILFIVLLPAIYALTNSAMLYVGHALLPTVEFTGKPLICWLAMGLQEGERAPGWFNAYIRLVAVENDYDSALMAQASAQEVLERIGAFAADPLYALWFFTKKILTQFCEPTFGALWNAFGGNDDVNQKSSYYVGNSLLQESFMSGGARAIYEIYCDAFQTLIYGLAAVGLFVQLKKKDGASVLFVIVFLGGFLYFTLFEAKSTYTMPYFVLLIMFAAVGLNAITARLSNKFDLEMSSAN